MNFDNDIYNFFLCIYERTTYITEYFSKENYYTSSSQKDYAKLTPSKFGDY